MDIAEKHDVSLHAFADDMQSYIYGILRCHRFRMPAAAVQLERYISDIGHWMLANRLKLNVDKTELLWVEFRYIISEQGCYLRVLHLGSDTIVASDRVRLLGVIFSSDLSLDRHSQLSLRPVSSGYGSSDVVNVHLTRVRQLHSCMHSCRHALVTATLSWHLSGK